MDIKKLAKNICNIKPHYFVKVDYKKDKGYVDSYNQLVEDFEAAMVTPNRMLIEDIRQRFISKYYWHHTAAGFKTIERHIKVCKIERPETK